MTNSYLKIASSGASIWGGTDGISGSIGSSSGAVSGGIIGSVSGGGAGGFTVS